MSTPSNAPFAFNPQDVGGQSLSPDDEPFAGLLGDDRPLPHWQWQMAALESLRPGGRLVINAIRKENRDRELMASIRYEDHLWQEKEIKSVANVTARDIAEFLPIAAAVPLRVDVQTYALEEANRALGDLRAGHVRGAKVLIIKTDN